MTSPLADDPRGRGLAGCFTTLYRELEPGDEIVSVTLTVLSGAQLVTYALEMGHAGVRRLVSDLGDPEVLAAVLGDGDAGGRLFADATPPDDLAGEAA